MPRCLEPDHHADFRALEVRHLLQRTTAHNRRQKTTFVAQFIIRIGKVVSKPQSRLEGGLTRRLCVHWAKSYSAALKASKTSKLYPISMAWIVKGYRVRRQSLKNYNCRDPCQRQNAAVMVKTMHQNGLHDI